MSHSVSSFGMCAAAILSLLLLAARSAPVHVVLPDVVTLDNGHAITLYSPPHGNSYAESSEALISVDQDMLLHALAATPDIAALPSAYDHSKHFAQLPATSSFDTRVTLSSKARSDVAADPAHTRTTELSIITEIDSADSAHATSHSQSSSAAFALTLPATRHRTSSTLSISSETSTGSSALSSATSSPAAAAASSGSGLDALFSFLASSSDSLKTTLSSDQTLLTTAATLSAESLLSTSKPASSAAVTSSVPASQSGSSTSSLFAWLSRTSLSSPTSTATSTVESSSSGSSSSGLSSSVLESSTSLDSFSHTQSSSSSSQTSDMPTTLSSDSKSLLPVSSTTSSTLSTSATSDSITPLAWASLSSDSSLQLVGSLEMLYPFTTHIPLLAASPTQASYDIHSPGLERTAPASATPSSDLVATSHSFASASSPPSRTIPLAGSLSSPLTLQSGDFIEMVVSHSPAPTTTHTPSTSSFSETHGWASLPVDIERLELSSGSDMSQAMLKRSPNSDASSLTAELLSEAAESARSLLSVMRNIATQSDNDQPARHATSTHIRDRQFIYLEEDPAAPAPALYKGVPAPEYRNVYYPPSTLTTTTTVTPDCTTATTTTTLDHTTTTTSLSTTTTTESNSCFTGFPSIPINVDVTLIQPTV